MGDDAAAVYNTDAAREQAAREKAEEEETAAHLKKEEEETAARWAKIEQDSLREQELLREQKEAAVKAQQGTHVAPAQPAQAPAAPAQQGTMLMNGPELHDVDDPVTHGIQQTMML